MATYRDLNDFLRQHKSTKDDPITHTRIGNLETRGVKEGTTAAIFPGKYNIPSDELEIFYKLYHRHVFVNKKDEHLTEVQRKDGKGPVLIDLDFRYDPDVTERQHCDDHITDLCDKYTDTFRKYLNFGENDKIRCYVFQKPGVNTTNPSVTKDGIHIMFDLAMDHTLQQMVRSDILKSIDDVLEELPLTNDYESVLDDGISKGGTNWQLYGSCKPGNETYQLIRYVEYIYNVEDEDFEYVNKPLGEINHLKMLSKVSAQRIGSHSATIKDKYKEVYEKNKPKEKKLKLVSKKKQRRNAFTIHGIEDAIGNVHSVEDISKVVDELFNYVGDSDYKLKETHEFTMALPEKYYDGYNEWIRVGWALYNCDYKMFWTWMLFSSQSNKFSFDDIGKNFELWNSFQDEGFTERSIMYWAMKDNPVEYHRIRDKTVEHFINISVKSKAEWDIGNVIYHFWKNKYRCASIKFNIWYEFINNRWVELDSASSLRNNISKFLARRYGDLSSDFISYSTEEANVEIGTQSHENAKNRAKDLAEICVKLKKTNFKQCVIKECATIFYEEDKHFLRKLDNNKMLLGFKNGVYDFDQKIFRDGVPEDYISLSTHIDYVPIDRNDANHIQIISEINAFMDSLFPNPELRRYVWDHLASVLIGGNKPQTFNIYNGSGRNGKSKLVELMTMILGDYKGVVPTTLVTSNRQTIGGLSPEVAQLKGVRYAVMQEPKKGERLNDGVMKELTGEDPIQARALFKDTITFVPQFKLVVSTNNLFDIGSNDDGTWRRIRKVDFESKFVDHPNPTEESPYEFKVDRDIDRRFKKWKNIFMSMLIERACETMGEVVDCDKVMEASSEYRKGQDYLMEFMKERIKKATESDRIKKTEVYEEFKNWFNINYGKNVPKGRELYEFLDKKLGKHKNGWAGYVMNYEDDDDMEEEDSD